MDDILIKVEHLKKYYKDLKVVDDISFEVKYKEVVALLGPNGAGKTTTLEILEGLRKYTEGKIYYFGKQVNEIGPNVKERIGVLLQETSLITQLTVYETFALYGALYKKSISPDTILDLLNLKDKRKAYIGKLSGGQKQRVGLGLAIINDPDIVFLDEPTTGLDPQARHNIWEIIKKLKEKGKTIFLTTHYMEEAEKLADYIYIIDHGHIIAEGSPKTLISTLDEDGRIEFNLSEKKNIKEVFPDIEIKDELYRLKTKNINLTMETLFKWSKKNNVDILNIFIRKPNLEDLFLELTGRTLRD